MFSCRLSSNFVSKSESSLSLGFSSSLAFEKSVHLVGDRRGGRLKFDGEPVSKHLLLQSDSNRVWNFFVLEAQGVELLEDRLLLLILVVFVPLFSQNLTIQGSSSHRNSSRKFAANIENFHFKYNLIS